MTFYVIAAGCVFLAAINAKLAWNEKKSGCLKSMWGYVALAVMWTLGTAGIVALELHLF